MNMNMSINEICYTSAGSSKQLFLPTQSIGTDFVWYDGGLHKNFCTQDPNKGMKVKLKNIYCGFKLSSKLLKSIQYPDVSIQIYSLIYFTIFSLLHYAETFLIYSTNPSLGISFKKNAPRWIIIYSI